MGQSWPQEISLLTLQIQALKTHEEFVKRRLQTHEVTREISQDPAGILTNHGILWKHPQTQKGM